jgi:hypothetical protein
MKEVAMRVTVEIMPHLEILSYLAFVVCIGYGTLVNLWVSVSTWDTMQLFLDSQLLHSYLYKLLHAMPHLSLNEAYV